jgi:hypothetical protein
MDRIGREITNELARFGPASGMAELVAAWPEAVGESIARNAWPARISRDGTLHVATSSSAWSFELGHLEREIASRLRAALGPAAPPALRFAPGRLAEPGAEDLPKARAEVRQPSQEDVETAARAAASIEDESLRKLVAKAAALSLARADSDRSF